mmetsp:Transcript_82547/g.231494  ORF Transcript_82547/g.231494 Transcript_82547/m.231494 type:complete len:256 (-) Transcript_82547:129-896(-)
MPRPTGGPSQRGPPGSGQRPQRGRRPRRPLYSGRAQMPMISAGQSMSFVETRTSLEAASYSGVPSGMPSSTARLETFLPETLPTSKPTVSGKPAATAGAMTMPQSPHAGGGGRHRQTSCSALPAAGGASGMRIIHDAVNAIEQEHLGSSFCFKASYVCSNASPTSSKALCFSPGLSLRLLGSETRATPCLKGKTGKRSSPAPSALSTASSRGNRSGQSSPCECNGKGSTCKCVSAGVRKSWPSLKPVQVPMPPML